MPLKCFYNLLLRMMVKICHGFCSNLPKIFVLLLMCGLVCRVHLEALKEKELVTITMDSEGEEDNAKGGQSEAKDDLPASQPLPASNELLLDEEDLIIDVYISD